MLSSYFADGEEARLVEHISRYVFGNPMLVPFDDQIYDSHGASLFITHLFAKLQVNGELGSGDREVGLGMLVMALQDETRLAAEILKDGRLKSFLERVPAIFEFVSEPQEAGQFLRAWELLLYRDAGIGANLSKIMPRLLNKIVEFLSKGVLSGSDDDRESAADKKVKESLGVAMLGAVARSQYQNTLTLHTDSLLNLCLVVREWNEELKLQTLFAQVMSLESPAAWQGVWSLLTDKASDLCRDYLGIAVQARVVSKSAKKSSDAEISAQKARGNSVGALKATQTALEVVLQRLSQALQRGDMAHFGGMVFASGEKESTNGNSKKHKQAKGAKAGQNGCVGAIAAETVYRRLLGTLGRMLEVGCATGAVQLDLQGFLPLNRAVLGVSIASNAHTTALQKALLVPGPAGISSADLMLVTPCLKVSTLRLLQAILAIRSPALLKAGAELSEPVAHLLTSTECQRNPLVAEAAVSAIASIAECFPTILARHLSRAVEILAGLYAAEVGHLTSEPAIATASSVGTAKANSSSRGSSSSSAPSDATLPFSTRTFRSSTLVSSSSFSSTARVQELVTAVTPGLYVPDIHTGLSSNCASAAGTLTVFASVESILLHCAVYLPDKLQDRLEYTTGQALHCLAKGLLPGGVPHKAVKRAKVAPLRLSPDLQGGVLRIARADLSYPRSTGMRSGNAALLLTVCEATKHQTATVAESATCLMLLEALLNPTSAPLLTPSFDAIAAKKARRELEQQEEEEQAERARAEQLQQAARTKRSAEESQATSPAMDGQEGGPVKRAKNDKIANAPPQKREDDDSEDESEDESEQKQEKEMRAPASAVDDDDDFEMPEIV